MLGCLPAGRSMVIQRKRYTPRSKIPSREVRDLLGAKVHFKVDVAIFVATTYVSGSAEEFAAENGMLAVHRDHLGLGNNGAWWLGRRPSIGQVAEVQVPLADRRAEGGVRRTARGPSRWW
ncbi:restriction endonuclease [Streptomyces sp. rh34]|uniref:restriction endonuclease n=1 Tax=Streptomyces sp. rh34 TaxID=2034272 RepID=UPI00211D4BA4|nr:restriction endonuclease [Streptomyces sp. rh34]